jgi:hypothetical protein
MEAGMKAGVFRGIGDSRLEAVPEPKIQARLTAAAPKDAYVPIGLATTRNITVERGNCDHRRSAPHLPAA